MATSTVQTTIAPWLTVKDSRAALAFYKAAFSAVEVYLMEFDTGIVARLSVNGGEFWIGDESPEHENFSPESLGGATVRIILSTPDPEALFNQALMAGATTVYPVGEEHGWKIGRIKDPFGHHWEIGREL